MVLDAAVAILLGLGLLRGWSRGFLFQLGQVALVVVAFLVGRLLGTALAPTLTGLGASPATASLLAFWIVFGIVFTVGSFLLRRATRDVHQGAPTLGRADRWVGASVGLAKAAVLAYLAFVALIMVSRITGKVPIPVGSSASGRWVMQHNFLDSEDFPRAKALVKLGTLLGTRGPLDLVGNPHFVAIIQHPKAGFLRSPDVVRALAQRDWVALVSREELWDLLDEPAVQAHLNAIEWDERPAEAPDPLVPIAPQLTSSPLERDARQGSDAHLGRPGP